MRELEAKLAQADKERIFRSKPGGGRTAMLACHRGAARLASAAVVPHGATTPRSRSGAATNSMVAATPAAAEAAASGAAAAEPACVKLSRVGAPERAGSAAVEGTMAAIGSDHHHHQQQQQQAVAAALWEAEVAAAAEAQLALERVGALAEQLTQDLAPLRHASAVLPHHPWLLKASSGAAAKGDRLIVSNLAAATTDLPPITHPQLALLQAHIISLERRLQLRELDARELASRAAALSSAELQSMRAQHKAELARKNAQIDTFRAEIDAITSELVQLHEQQAEAVCVVHRK